MLGTSQRHRSSSSDPSDEHDITEERGHDAEPMAERMEFTTVNHWAMNAGWSEVVAHRASWMVPFWSAPLTDHHLLIINRRRIFVLLQALSVDDPSDYRSRISEEESAAPPDYRSNDGDYTGYIV